jgi:predicted small lipoprotein YifL
MKTMPNTDRARTRMTLSICSLALALAVAAGACGQRGPLYLPDSDPAGEKAANEASVQDEGGQQKDKESENEKTP